MEALNFDLHIEISTFNLFSLYDRYIEIRRIQKDELDLKWLFEHTKNYYKSRSFFAIHPLHFNLIIFQKFLERENSEISLS